jgi:hypothetical protein
VLANQEEVDLDSFGKIIPITLPSKLGFNIPTHTKVILPERTNATFQMGTSLGSCQVIFRKGERLRAALYQSDNGTYEPIHYPLSTKDQILPPPPDLENIDDARTRVIAEIVRRQGQRDFRLRLLRAYNGKCAVTSTDLEDVLEAAHIFPYQGAVTNQTSNGILLRSDIHLLFDTGLMTIDPETLRVNISSKLIKTQYRAYSNIKINIPISKEDQPSLQALILRQKMFKSHNEP